MTLGLKQFRVESCLSYLLFDRVSREACWIDPHLALLEDFRVFVSERGLRAVWILETQLHPDHFSASHLLAAETGATIAMSEATESARPGRRLRDGERIRVGSFEALAIATPGVSPDSMIYRLEEFSGRALVAFTGNTILPGVIGWAGAPPPEFEDSGALWDTLRKLPGALEPRTPLLPSHDLTGLLFTTLESELRNNPELSMDRESFLRSRAEAGRARVLGTPLEISRRLEFNSTLAPFAGEILHEPPSLLRRPVIPPSIDRAASLGVEKFRLKLDAPKSNDAYLDVREPEEYSAGHVAGMTNLPLSELALHLSELRQCRRIYLLCLSGWRSQQAARTLAAVGLADVVEVSGGFQAWETLGYPIETDGKKRQP